MVAPPVLHTGSEPAGDPPPRSSRWQVLRVVALWPKLDRLLAPPQSSLGRAVQSSSVVPALFAFVLAVGVLFPLSRALPEHAAGDESEYAWTAAYYGGKLARLDFRPDGPNELTDPGWSPVSYWAITQPMGARVLYAATLAMTGLPAPMRPYIDGDPAFHGPETRVAWPTLLALRVTAVLAAALGLGLLAWRLGWRGTLAAAVVLAIPHAREDLARAWAEGPLILGFGLCAAAYGSRRFPYACGVAATFKLTALLAWPLLLWPGAAGASRSGRLLGLPAAAMLWSALTPPSWFLLGPVYLGAMLLNRQAENAAQSTVFGTLFVPTRYLLPFELLAAVCLVWLGSRLWKSRPW